MRYFLFFILLFSIGCSSYIPEIKIKKATQDIKARQIIETIYIDKDFNKREKDLLNLAKLKWEQNTDNIIKLNFIYNYDFNTKSDDSYKKVFIKLDSNNEFYISLADKKKENFSSISIRGVSNNEYLILVRDRIDSEYELYIKFLQLIGLSIDLPYLDNHFIGIMNKDQKRVSCLTENDINLFCAHFLCNPKQLSYCTIKKEEENLIIN